MFKIAKSKDPSLCVAYRCKNKRYKNDRFCCKHRRRYTRENNPARYTYDLLRQNAKTRGKEFTLTFKEYLKFCEETGYLEKRGKTGKSASIDRKDPNKGYSYGNIQLLTLSENSSKRWEDEAEAPPF